jgi:sugar transferase (PEP-CTERM/EpsH1 system associated)
MRTGERPLVLHVLHRFDTGGLENGVANLINHMPMHRYRHAVLALTEVTDFRHRIARQDVEFIALHKGPGQTAWQFHRLFQIFRQLRPHIVHSRNLAALEAQLPAWAAGVPVRIHGEHGLDPHSKSSMGISYDQVRRFYKPWVHHYLALSNQLKTYLEERVHVPHAHISKVTNGVDGARFHPPCGGPKRIDGCPFDPAQHWLVGWVGRMQAVKDPVLLARAFVQAVTRRPSLHGRLRLVMVGNGPQQARARQVLQGADMTQLAWFPGERSDVPDILRGLHAFALPSLSEGISNVVLEAMASGLPVLATRVGGNPELVLQGQTGYLVEPADPCAMATGLLRLAGDPAHAAALGRSGRARVEERFSMQAMVRAYQAIYDAQLREHGHAALLPD